MNYNIIRIICWKGRQLYPHPMALIMKNLMNDMIHIYDNKENMNEFRKKYGIYKLDVLRTIIKNIRKDLQIYVNYPYKSNILKMITIHKDGHIMYIYPLNKCEICDEYIESAFMERHCENHYVNYVYLLSKMMFSFL